MICRSEHGYDNASEACHFLAHSSGAKEFRVEDFVMEGEMASNKKPHAGT
jgi:hypothetical protein